MIKSINNLKYGLENRNHELAITSLSQIQTIKNILESKYGNIEMKNHLNYLISSEDNSFNDNLETYNSRAPLGEHDGSSCTRNLNGTTYWGNCNFFESVSAAFSILINCDSLESADNIQEVEAIYDCHQSSICDNC